MKRNQKLEKYQKEAYNDHVGSFRFVVEVAGVTSEESDTLEAKKPGITLHFLRYGLFNNTDDINEVAHGVIAPFYDFDENGKAVPNQGVNLAPVYVGGTAQDFQPPSGPKFNSSFYQRTCLNEGFLYIIEDHEEFRCLEFYINELSGLHPILWSKNLDPEGNYSDDRSEMESLTGYTHTIKPGTTVWVAYSDVQWSIAQLETIQADANKKNRMQQFVCNPVEKSEENSFDDNSELMPYTNLKVSFKSHQNSQSYMFLDRLDRIALVEQKPDPENTQLEDLFITLYDPIGLCADASLHLRSLWLEMDALLIAIKTGVNPINIKQALLKGKKPEDLQKNKEDLKQIGALFNIATTLRSVAFANEENREDLIDCWGGLDTKRLELVLATKERKALQQKIKKAREELRIAFESEHFGIIKQDYIKNTDTNCALGKEYILQLLSQLSMMPNFKDGFMETAEESRKWIPKIDLEQRYIKRVLEGKTNVGMVFEKKTVLEHLESESNWLKWIGITNGFFDIASGLKEDGDEILSSITERANSTRIKIKGMVMDGAFELVDLGKEFSKTDVGRADFVKKTLNINKKTLKEFKKLAKKRVTGFDKLLKAKQITLTDAFSRAAHSDKTSGIADFQASPRWTKLLRNLSFFNLAIAGAALRKSDTSFQKYLNYAKFLNSIAEAHVAVREVKALAKNADNQLANYAAKTKVLTKRVAVVGVVIDAAEAGYNFWERDYDAAIAYSTSAVAGGLALVCLASGTAMGWNPVGWVLLIAAGVIGFYAAFLEDSPLENFVKNCLFARSGATEDGFFGLVDADVQLEGNYLKQIQQHVTLNNRKELTGNDDWIDYSVQYQKLMDILVAGRIALKITGKEVDKDRSWSTTEHGGGFGTTLHTSKTISKVTEITTEITFGGYLSHREQVEYEIYFLRDGLGANSELLSCKPTIEIKMEKEQLNKAIFIIPSYEIRHTDTGLIMVMARLKMSNSQHFPLENANGIPRYVAAIAPTIYSSTTAGLYMSNNKNDLVISDTKSKLLKKTQWK